MFKRPHCSWYLTVVHGSYGVICSKCQDHVICFRLHFEGRIFEHPVPLGLTLASLMQLLYELGIVFVREVCSFFSPSFAVIEAEGQLKPESHILNIQNAVLACICR